MRTKALLAALTAIVAAAGLGLTATGAEAHRQRSGGWLWRSLDGTGNNLIHPSWGAAGIIYPRVAPAHYADGLGQPVDGPNPRYVSNRILNDTGQALHSERNVSQWAFVWGQFLDHTFALRLGRRQTGEPGQPMPIPFDPTDPLEGFPNDIGIIFFERSVPAPGTGETTPFEQINQASSFIDARAVYGNEAERLDWLRLGSVDGNPGNNEALLLMIDGYLPRRDSRGDPDTAPEMVLGSLFATPGRAAVAGDQRANESPPLLSVQTLFAREHNRIVSQLPGWLPEQTRFEIARAVTIAEQQYVTYTEFLPALGVQLPRYSGYRPHVDPSLTNEFATVGYRAHSMIRSDFRIESDADRYDQDTLDALAAMGIEVIQDGDTVELIIPLGDEVFFNPDLIEMIELGPMLHGIGRNQQNNNDEQMTDLLRSLVFQFPLEGNPDAVGLNDLAAVDIQRGRDHGIPTYNELRVAYGLPPKATFQDITGEESEDFPVDPLLTPGDEINDPDSLDFTELSDINGDPTTPEAGNATSGVRRTPLAARLKAIYGDVDNVDAFVGMISEPHLPGSDLGELQLAIWHEQFRVLRDGDRFFYANYPLLSFVRHAFGIDYRQRLGDLIALNTDIPRADLPRNVFLTEPAGNG